MPGSLCRSVIAHVYAVNNRLGFFDKVVMFMYILIHSYLTGK